MGRKGILTVVSGFSGAGKGTIMKELVRQYDDYALSVSATTREPRPGEAEGREYFFRKVEEFEKMIAKEELIEYAKYVDNYYGTPRAYVEEQLEAGKDVILEIEIQGALKVKEKFPAFVRDASVGGGIEAAAGQAGHRDHGSDRLSDGKGQGRGGRNGAV